MTTQLRAHQQQALDNIVAAIQKGRGSAAGRILMPTGGGKTFVEAAIIDHQRTNNSKSRIHLVLAPRIILVNQLIKDYRTFSGSAAYRIVAFHSGKHEADNSVIKWQETSTTNYSDVIDEWDKAKHKDMDLVVFSTYHSCGKLDGIKFDTIIADESQYCVTEDFNNSVKKLSGRVRMFFTATEKHTSSVTGCGLNNAAFYGERLYEITPAELVKLGLIVPPIMHVMHGNTNDANLTVIDEVIEIGKAQDAYSRPKLGFSKILFAMNGTDDVAKVVDNLDKIRKDMPLHDVFTITARAGPMINGIAMRREQFLDKIKDAKDCLIFHYDILSEGIDVDGITGVALLRNMKMAKLQQTIGRAVRIYKPNPALKRNALISVPVLNGNDDDKVHVKSFINAIRLAGFDISYEMVYQTRDPRHIPDPEQVDDGYDANDGTFRNLFLQDVFHEIEADWFWIEVKNKTIPLDDALDVMGVGAV
jgi:superfamily II DNA or RNA helicase